MSATLQSLPSIHIREPATVNLGPVPECYEFLKVPAPQRKYRINFRHPAYGPDDNPLFTLYAWDHADGGIHHGFAHSACSIFADNRTDGYLSTTCVGDHGERVQAAWDEVLPAAVVDYYFYVPYPPDSPSPLTGHSRPPYRWPVVTNFQDWKFGRLPEIWTRCASIQGAVSSTAPQSNLSAAIHQRDITCRVTAFESVTEVAHLIPEHERKWFLSNSMAVWNADLTLDSDNLLRDLSNAVLLRSDIHTAFDQRKFVFFPKSPEGFVLHMLEPTPDIGQLYHNTRVDIPQCSLEFLFARFAWSIFPSLAGFLSRPSTSRLVARLNADGERVVEEVTNPLLLGRKATASRSNSPTKRSRVATDLNDHIEYPPQICDTESEESSFNSTLPALGDDSDSEKRPEKRPEKRRKTLNSSLSATHFKVLNATELYPPNNSPKCTGHLIDLEFSGMRHPDNLHQDVYINELRQAALAGQRPVGYDPQRPPYDRHRPAKEELELMGVEIICNLDEIQDSQWD